MRLNTLVTLLCVLGVVFVLGGCAGVQKAVPHLGFGRLDMQVSMSRGDIEVLETAEGSSSTESYLGGIVKIIDGEHLQVLGIKFFEDRYTRILPGDPLQVLQTGGGFLDKTLGRAYYRALTAHPEADAVFLKSIDFATWGIPLIYTRKTVTVRGKAIKLKSG